MNDNDMEVSSDTDTGTITPPPTVGCLALGINDPRGYPIPDLDFQIAVENNIVFSGKTDAEGKADVIENLKLGSVFNILVKTDKGEFKKVAIGTIEAEQNVACLTSPKSRFEFSTYASTGKSGKAAEHKKKVLESHNQIPDKTPTTSGNEGKKPSIKDDHDADGQPHARVEDGTTNMHGVNNGKAVPPPKEPLEKLKDLVAFMEHQATLNYTKMPQTEETEKLPKGSKKTPKVTKHDVTSEVIISQMRLRTFKEPETKLPTVPTKWCGRYVKIGLWYAGYGPATATIGSGTPLARSMGPKLIEAGFTDLSSKLPTIKINVGKKLIPQPDITYALPGDVIVYEKTGAPHDPGHIDVRTYHGFFSDIYYGGRNGFPNVKLDTVTGVYRKYSDTLAAARVKAFLRILREHATQGYSDPYFAMEADGKKITFTDTSVHPYAAKKEDKPTGAYQILWSKFNDALKVTGWPVSFTPADQDRAAIYALQGSQSNASYPVRTALGYIMEGKVEQAVNDTKLYKLFTFLPGGKKQLIDMDKLKQYFNTYTAEYPK